MRWKIAPEEVIEGSSLTGAARTAEIIQVLDERLANCASGRMTCSVSRRSIPALGPSWNPMLDYECCICKGTVSGVSGTVPLDPCALILVGNIDRPREDQKEQQFFCHFGCFRRLVNNDGIMYIMEADAATIGEIERDEENWSEDEARVERIKN